MLLGNGTTIIVVCMLLTSIFVCARVCVPITATSCGAAFPSSSFLAWIYVFVHTIGAIKSVHATLTISRL